MWVFARPAVTHEEGDGMKRLMAVLLPAAMVVFALSAPSFGKDNPNEDEGLQYLQRKLTPAPEQLDTSGTKGQQGSKLSKQQIIKFRCSSSGDPSLSVDMSCNDPNPDFGQDYAPDNEIAVAVDPSDPNHLLAGSNDYYYSF